MRPQNPKTGGLYHSARSRYPSQKPLHKSIPVDKHKSLEEKLLDLHSKHAPIQTKLHELPEYTDDAIKKLQKAVKVSPDKSKLVLEGEPVGSLLTIEDFFDVSNPEDFRRAILCYEILGRPLSLRDTGY